MHSMAVWPLLALVSTAMVFVPVIEESGNRSFVYWLILPPLLAGVLAACSQLRVS